MLQANFNDLEVLKMAMSMEDEGMEFYNSLAEKAQGEVKDFLLLAAAQEKVHKETFLKLYNELTSKLGNIDDIYLFEEETSAYLRSLIENEVFDKRNNPEKDNLEKDNLDLKASIDSAVKAESKTVALYTKMYEGSKYDEVKEVLKVLIEEEKDHVKYFSKFYEQL